jgi:site-specific DNA-cytosine methylase
LQRHLEAGGKARKGAASDAEGGARGGFQDTVGALCADTQLGAYGGQDAYTGRLIPAVLQPTAYRWQNDALGLQQDDAVAALRASAGSSGFHEMNHPVIAQPVAHAFYSTGGTHGVNQHPEVSPAVKVGSGLGIPSPPAVAHTLNLNCYAAKEDGTGRGSPLIPHAMTVRRLTPVECERLQGFPDDWTLIPWRKKPAEDCPDGPRYKALGNSMACNCMAWIGERIAKWEADHA